jgi:hypothetical protein
MEKKSDQVCSSRLNPGSIIHNMGQHLEPNFSPIWLGQNDRDLNTLPIMHSTNGKPFHIMIH